MPLLHIALQEGFEQEEVVLQINGKEVFHKSGVTTLTQIGFADSVESEVAAGPVQVEIDLPRRHAREALIVRLNSTPIYLKVSVTPEGRIEAVPSETAFRYA